MALWDGAGAVDAAWDPSYLVDGIWRLSWYTPSTEKYRAAYVVVENEC